MPTLLESLISARNTVMAEMWGEAETKISYAYLCLCADVFL